jgi:peptidyl-prolyl cis-trans isomerase B (cyclophilin B)
VASSKRERELARMRAERQAARRAAAEARRRQRQVIIASTVAVVLIAAGAAFAVSKMVGGDDSVDTANPGPTPTATASPKQNTADTCAYNPKGKASGDRKVELPPETGVEREKTYTAILDTNRGRITFDLDAKKAPCTSNNLRSLAHFLFYDGVSCHRLTTAGIYVLQCGDPTGTGSGGPGYEFPDENLKGATYPAGTVAMANAGAGTNGSQFFLVYKDTELPPQYTPFGKITSGLDILEKVAKGGVEVAPGGRPDDGKPKLDLVIKTLRTRLKAA